MAGLDPTRHHKQYYVPLSHEWALKLFTVLGNIDLCSAQLERYNSFASEFLVEAQYESCCHGGKYTEMWCVNSLPPVFVLMIYIFQNPVIPRPTKNNDNVIEKEDGAEW